MNPMEFFFGQNSNEETNSPTDAGNPMNNMVTPFGGVIPTFNFNPFANPFVQQQQVGQELQGGRQVMYNGVSVENVMTMEEKDRKLAMELQQQEYGQGEDRKRRRGGLGVFGKAISKMGGMFRPSQEDEKMDFFKEIVEGPNDDYIFQKRKYRGSEESEEAVKKVVERFRQIKQKRVRTLLKGTTHLPTYLGKKRVQRRAHQRVGRRNDQLWRSRSCNNYYGKFVLSTLPVGRVVWKEPNNKPVTVLDLLNKCEYIPGKIVQRKPKTILSKKVENRFSSSQDLSLDVDDLGSDDHVKVAPKMDRPFEICFLIDVTGSNRFVEILKTKIEAIIAQLLNDINVRISFITFGDYTDYKMYYLLKKYDFSNDVRTISKNIKSIQQTGGGKNLQEAYELALLELRKLNWSAVADKYVVIIGDSTPYSVKSCPLKIDWRSLVDTKDKRVYLNKEKNNFITCLSIQCLNNSFATPFYKEISSRRIVLNDFSNTEKIFEIFIGICYKNVDKYDLSELLKNFSTLKISSENVFNIHDELNK